jgi:hypothetical protein
MFKDYYLLLGISPGASKEEIKQAYRAMSLKWHPDRNPGIDVTSMMQDINEAYKILNDNLSRARYDKEYHEFCIQREYCQPVTHEAKSDSWNYNYDVHDEDLKKDINNARVYAKDLVDDFLKNLKGTVKVAAKGGWEGAKGYIYAAIILSVFGLCIRGCMGILKNNMYSYDNSQNGSSLADTSLVSDEEPVYESEAFQAPNTWQTYHVANHAFSLSVPPTVELRHEYDKYVKRIKELGLTCNTDDMVFEQKGLANNTSEALSHYCRIIIQHVQGEKGDFPSSTETFPLDADIKADLREIAENELGPAHFIGEPTYKWISIGATKAIEISYRRTGIEKYTTACKMYLMTNADEAVKIIVSYREQESDFWLPDLANVIKTFNWE